MKMFLQKFHICRKIDSILFINLLICVCYSYSWAGVVSFLLFLNTYICIFKKFYVSFWMYPLVYFLVRPDFTKVEHVLNENMENTSIISKAFPK